MTFDLDDHGPTELVVTAVTRPRELEGLGEARWDELLVRLRNARLLARAGEELEACGLLDRIPTRAADQLRAERVVAAENARMIHWEVDRIERALRDVDVPVILLKGAAYALAGLPPARGRLSSDVDVMVPKESLAAVEGALLRSGWEAIKLDPYDQRYYRTWMHELPPLCHRERHTVVDVHHTILPESGRLRPDPRALAASARPLHGKWSVLAPADMILHSAAHMFQDGELNGGLRDLVDIDCLLRHFGRDPSFWTGLVPRARELTLARPLFYALLFCRALLSTPVPVTVWQEADAAAPPAPVRWLMSALTRRGIEPDGWEPPSAGTSVARFSLYVRSHWLRMPPLLLARHLVRKALSRGIDRA